MVSTVGYKFVTSKLFTKLGIHDTCGVGNFTITATIITTGIAITSHPQVNNLHGMPGLMGGVLSVIVVFMAS